MKTQSHLFTLMVGWRELLCHDMDKDIKVLAGREVILFGGHSSRVNNKEELV